MNVIMSTNRRKRAAGLTGSLLAGLILAGTQFPANAASPALNKLDAPTRSLASLPAAKGSTRVIVRLTGLLTEAHAKALASLGATITNHLPIIHSVALSIPSRSLSRLAALPFVSHLSLDGRTQKSDEFTTDATGADAAQTQYGLTGAGVTVAVIDSGINAHDDLSTMTPGLLPSKNPTYRITAAVNFVSSTSGNSKKHQAGAYGQVEPYNGPDVQDQCGHGTHVAGILGGNGYDSTSFYGIVCYQTFSGIAPQVNLVNVKVLNNNGGGAVSDVVAGIQWVVNNAQTYGIRVINLSLGHPVGESYTTDPLCQAVEAAEQSGIVVVCAAGNNGRLNPTVKTEGSDNEGWGTAYGSIESPGNDPYVITVGAVKPSPAQAAQKMAGVTPDYHNNQSDLIATYSSRGPTRLDLVLKPDLVAPGNQVISTATQGAYLENAYQATNGITYANYVSNLNNEQSKKQSPSYFVLSGTSMATPVVAGAAALLLQQNPALSPDTIKARLMISADKMTNPSGNGDPCSYGAGLLDIPQALACTAVTTQTAMSPSLSEDALGNVSITMDHAVWGNNAIWGTNINDLHAIWGTNAIWGSSTMLASSNAIWGTSVWNDHAIWGTAAAGVDLSSIVLTGE